MLKYMLEGAALLGLSGMVVAFCCGLQTGERVWLYGLIGSWGVLAIAGVTHWLLERRIRKLRCTWKGRSGLVIEPKLFNNKK